MKRTMLLAAGMLAALLPAPARSAPPPGASPFSLEAVGEGGRARTLEAWDQEGVILVAVDDVSRLLGVSFGWLPELGKVTLYLGRHRVWMLEGSDIAVVDEETLVHLPGTALRWEGRMLVPLSLLVDDAGRSRPWVDHYLVFSREERTLAATEERRATIVSVTIHPDPLGWKLLLEADAPFRHRLVRSEQASFILRLSGVDLDPVRVTLPPDHPWFHGLRFRGLRDGVEVTFSPGAAAVGYRVSRSPGGLGLEIFLGLDERDVREGRIRRFTESRARIPRTLRRIALDAGHGGDASPESRLAMELTWRVAAAVRDAFGADVLILRDPEEDPSPALRAERANRSEADLLLSFHLHRRRGGPAGYVARLPAAIPGPPPELRELGFRSFFAAQSGFLPVSRMLARNLVQAVAVRLGTEPVGVFDEPMTELQGAAMPAAMLEIGVGDEGLTEGDLDAMADAVVEALRLFLLAGEM